MATPGHPLNENLKGVAWLLGKWRTEDGHGGYPTLKDFTYEGEIEFTHVGQPNLEFSLYTWNSETKEPLHREFGFVRAAHNSNKVALIIAQNTATCELQEGEVNGQEMTTTSYSLSQPTFVNDHVTKKVIRTFCREGDTLRHIVQMETNKTPLAQFLNTLYQKIE